MPEFTGVILSILPPKTGTSPSSGKEWTIQEVIAKSTDSSREIVRFTFWGELIPRIKTLKVMDIVEIEYRLASREYEDGKWSLQATARTITPLVSRAEIQFKNLFSRIESIAGIAKSLADDSLMSYDPRRAALDLLNCLTMMIPDTGLPVDKQKPLTGIVDEICNQIQQPVAQTSDGSQQE